MPGLLVTTPSAGENIASWALSGAYDADKPILVDAFRPERTITKNIAVELVSRLAGAFEADSTVCLHLDNDVLYPILSLAIYASNCRWTGTNTSNKVAELEHLFSASEAKYVVTEVANLATVQAAVDNIGKQIEIILFSDILTEAMPGGAVRPSLKRDLGPHSKNFRTLHDLLGDGTPESLAEMLKDVHSGSIATLMSTSGTTGKPKMAARDHAAVVREGNAVKDDNKPYEVRRLFCTPVFHSFTMTLMVLDTVKQGHTAYIMKRFDDVAYPAKISEFQITETIAPPGMLLRLANDPACYVNIQSLRTIFSGGAPIVPELRSKFLSIYPEKKPRIAVVWGMTEGGWFTTFKYPENDETSSVGRPLPGLDIKVSLMSPVALDNGGQAGELLVRGEQMMTGYLNNPIESRGAFTEDGWLRTGDIGHIAEDGKVYLVDRAKDLIKVNGWQVSPAELEDALLVLPDIKDSGVVGLGDNVDEHPVAFVVRRHRHVTATEVKEHLLSRLAGYKVRTCEIHFVDEIPRSPTGKILRNVLKTMAAAYV